VYERKSDNMSEMKADIFLLSHDLPALIERIHDQKYHEIPCDTIDTFWRVRDPERASCVIGIDNESCPKYEEQSGRNKIHKKS